jgi:hypothetical protein
MLRLLTIGFVWLGCAVAWVILGSTLVARTSGVESSLDREVHALWGQPGNQLPPRATYTELSTTKEIVTTTNAVGAATQQTVEKQVPVERALTLDASDIKASFELEQRRKGLLWFPTYEVTFAARYAVLNQTDAPREATLSFPLIPGGGSSEKRASFDDFSVTDAAGKPLAHEIQSGAAVWKTELAPGARHEFRVAYRSRGTSSWTYALPPDSSEIKNFRLSMATSFPNVDFPAGTTSPSHHSVDGSRWQGDWEFASLITGTPIGIEMPTLLNPGPLASKVTFFAPLSLLFFFFVVAILSFVKKRELHALHYLLLGCAFFAFHLLFAYLVDHLPIAQSFTISSLVSVALVISYARLFVGWRFAVVEMGLSQLVYLVLFSLTFFWEGYTGLAITIGAILTLFLVMQITGRFKLTVPSPAHPQPSAP